MKTALLALSGLMLLWMVPQANSDCAVRRRVVVNRAVVVEQAAVVATPIVATQFVGIPIPTYGVSYVGDHGYGDVAKLAEKIDRLEALLNQLAGSGPPPNGKAPEQVAAPKEQTVTERAIALVQNKCAQCHAAGPNAKGPSENGKVKPFVMFDLKGQLQVTPKLLGTIYRGATANGVKMPPDPGRPFGDEEVAVIQDGLGR